jgi:4-amino-4-deoxy-L-arabinose transferase-like glycosyltransferase
MNTSRAKAAPESVVKLASDLLLLTGCCAFLFFFGLGSLGLVGADEPRYAQIAREMFARHDWITPVLQGKPWLEKPILYYWEAMLSYSVFGVHDWAARLPAALNAAALVAAVYFFVRRFFRGAQLDAALITASTAFIAGFGHAASTDMPLAATFALGMLSWMAWHFEQRRVWLYGFYLWMALGTLAKGPVAPFLAGAMIVLLAALRRRGGIILRTLSWRGMLLYFAVAAPWYILVQQRTGNFFRVFLLEHNLGRFSTSMYHHQQPFWYFCPVLLIALVPWTVPAIAGFVHAVRASRPRDPQPQSNAESRESCAADGNLLLILWSLVPVVFFSFSASKLPGYILPSVPPCAILAALWLRQKWIASATKVSRALLLLHALVAGGTLAALLLLSYVLLRLHPPRAAIQTAAVAGAIAFGMVFLVVRTWGLRTIRLVTLLPVILGVSFLLRVAAPALDSQLSARPVAHALLQLSPAHAPVAAYDIDRELEYGLNFYLNRPIALFERAEIPASGDYVLVMHHAPLAEVEALAPNRRFLLLDEFPSQNLTFYWVSRN